MATKGKWQISKDFPEAVIAVTSSTYRIYSDESNESSIIITIRINYGNSDVIHTLNPGSSVDLYASKVIITSKKLDTKLSGTFETVK